MVDKLKGFEMRETLEKYVPFVPTDQLRNDVLDLAVDYLNYGRAKIYRNLKAKVRYLREHEEGLLSQMLDCHYCDCDYEEKFVLSSIVEQAIYLTMDNIERDKTLKFRWI